MISDVSTHLIRHSGMLCRLGYQQLLTASKYLFHSHKMFNKTAFGFFFFWVQKQLLALII